MDDILSSENRDIFVMKNCIYNFKNQTFIKSTISEDLINTGWNYSEVEANKYLPNVEEFFKNIFPDKDKHDLIVTFFSSLIHGYRLDKKFLVFLTYNKNEKFLLINLLNIFFGDYKIFNNNFLLNKNVYENIENFKGKRLLICDKSEKHNSLNESLIQNLTGGEYKVEGRHIGKTDLFKFTWQAGIIMIFNEEDCPEFDCTDSAFMDRMNLIPLRTKFVIEDYNTFTSKFILWRSSILIFFLKYAKLNN